MDQVSLAVEERREVGKSAARKLRSAHLIPGVVYGKEMGSVPVSVDARALRDVLKEGRGTRSLINLQLFGRSHLALIREVQVHPVRRVVEHVDIMVVDPSKRMVFEVPVVLEGEAEAVEREGGRVEQLLHFIPVRCLPTQIPEHLTGDVSTMAVGSVLKVGDLLIPEGVQVEMDEEVVVAVGQPPRVPRARAGQAGESQPESSEEGSEEES